MKEVNKFDLEIQSFDIKEYLYKIASYWKLFAVTVVIALVIAKIVNTTSQKVYKLKTLITVSDEQNPLFSSSTNIAFNWGGPSDKVETIITILQSRTKPTILPLDNCLIYTDTVDATVYSQSKHKQTVYIT